MRQKSRERQANPGWLDPVTKTRREQGGGSRGLMVGGKTRAPRQMPGVNESRLLRLEHKVREAGLTAKATGTTPKERGRGVPGSPCPRARWAKPKREQRTLRPHEAAVPRPALGPHSSWRHQSAVLTRLRGAPEKPRYPGAAVQGGAPTQSPAKAQGRGAALQPSRRHQLPPPDGQSPRERKSRL